MALVNNNLSIFLARFISVVDLPHSHLFSLLFLFYLIQATLSEVVFFGEVVQAALMEFQVDWGVYLLVFFEVLDAFVALVVWEEQFGSLEVG